ncbi:MAG TPA: TonB-dependent receptor, partial [Bacillota bacterium]|nr:TonB-dependent receptor [Bacillota bacterium]
GIPMFPGQAAGDIKYLDVDGSGDITENDRVPLGSNDPNVTYFANLNFNYKGFDFDAQFNGAGNVGVFYTDRIAIPLNLGENGGTPQKWHTDYWTPDNPDARFPRLTPSPGSNGLFSNFWKVDGSFLRVRYVQIGYDVKRLMKNSRIDGLRVYFNAQNPFTFTSVETIDPETKGNQSTHPMFKTYSFGVNLKF